MAGFRVWTAATDDIVRQAWPVNTPAEIALAVNQWLHERCAGAGRGAPATTARGVLFRAESLGLISSGERVRLEKANASALRRAAARPAVPPRLRQEVLERDGCCQLCGRSEQLEVDHLLAHARGGSLAKENLWALCRSCNARKSKRAYPLELAAYARESQLWRHIRDLEPNRDHPCTPDRSWVLRRLTTAAWGDDELDAVYLVDQRGPRERRYLLIEIGRRNPFAEEEAFESEVRRVAELGHKRKCRCGKECSRRHFSWHRDGAGGSGFAFVCDIIALASGFPGFLIDDHGAS